MIGRVIPRGGEDSGNGDDGEGKVQWALPRIQSWTKAAIAILHVDSDLTWTVLSEVGFLEDSSGNVPQYIPMYPSVSQCIRV